MSPAARGTVEPLGHQLRRPAEQAEPDGQHDLRDDRGRLAALGAYRAFALANLLAAQTGRLLGGDGRDDGSGRLAYTLWAMTHGLVSPELAHASRSPLAHPVLADIDGRDVLDPALSAAMLGRSRSGASS
jgi:hypothetical protein